MIFKLLEKVELPITKTIQLRCTHSTTYKETTVHAGTSGLQLNLKWLMGIFDLLSFT